MIRHMWRGIESRSLLPSRHGASGEEIPPPGPPCRQSSQREGSERLDSGESCRIGGTQSAPLSKTRGRRRQRYPPNVGAAHAGVRHRRLPALRTLALTEGLARRAIHAPEPSPVFAAPTFSGSAPSSSGCDGIPCDRTIPFGGWVGHKARLAMPREAVFVLEPVRGGQAS